VSGALLGEIVATKRADVHRRKSRRALQELKSRIADAEATRPFQAALEREGDEVPRLIAELKRASPSKGLIRKDFRPLEIAQIYEKGGASAISVLTEVHYFLGNPSYLSQVRAKVALPLLQKDFILDEFQLYEARAWGADAVLLIAALLEPRQMKDYSDLARGLSMEVLVEIHTEKELECVVEWAPVIGINNRDLETFETDIETTFRILPEIPLDRVVVSESGIASRADMARLGRAGLNAVLIGESFMAEKDIEAKMNALLGDQ